MTRIDQGDPPDERILYLPIFEPGVYHARSRANKRGLREALKAYGEVFEWDYLAHEPRSDVRSALAAHISAFRPTLIVSQLQGTDALNGDDIRALRQQYPRIKWVNWNGDYWPEHLTSPDMLNLAREMDVQLVVNGGVLADYEAEGVHGAFWPFGFEPVADDALLEMPAHDVVYLGNNYSEARADLYKVLRGLKHNVGIYGNGWPQSDGETTYDFASGAALYANAKIAISDAQWPDADGYLSNRPFEAMAAGTLVLQQRVNGLEEMTGLKDGVHWILFDSVDELPELVAAWLAKGKAKQRAAIAASAKQYVRRWHSWDERVRVLFEKLLP